MLETYEVKFGYTKYVLHVLTPTDPKKWPCFDVYEEEFGNIRLLHDSDELDALVDKIEQVNAKRLELANKEAEATKSFTPLRNYYITNTAVEAFIATRSRLWHHEISWGI